MFVALDHVTVGIGGLHSVQSSAPVKSLCAHGIRHRRSPGGLGEHHHIWIKLYRSECLIIKIV